jgi:hypothetical protein
MSQFIPFRAAHPRGVAMSAGAPIPPRPPYPTPPYSNVPPPPRAGNSGLRVVLIVVGVFVALGILAACVIGFVGYRVAKSAHHNSDGSVSFATPNGTITTGKSLNLTTAELGTDPYPGAAASAGSMNMKTATGSVITAIYTTSDPAGNVVAFYKEKLGDQASVVQSSRGTTFTSGERDKDQLTISITPHGDLTRIAIVHVTQNK